MLILGIILLLVPTASWAFRCPGPDWTPRRNTTFCYFIQHPKPGVTELLEKTWKEAQTECRVRGGQLTDLTDLEEMSYIKSKMGKTPSLDSGDIDFWTSLSYENGSWNWMDQQKPFVLGSLGPEIDPSQDHYFLGAVTSQKRDYRGVLRFSSDGSFYLTTAHSQASKTSGDKKRNYFICKAVFSNRPLCKTDDGWHYFNDRCLLSMPEMAPFEDARKSCLAEGGYVSVPSNLNENMRLNELAGTSSSETAWIGVGFIKTAETTVNSVRFDDGTPLVNRSYTSWSHPSLDRTFQNFITGREYCGYLTVQMFSDPPKWTLSASCSEPRPYACETELEKCPYGWDHFEDYCYQFRGSDTDIRSWTDAQIQCELQGGNLARVTQPLIQDFFNAKIEALGYTGMSYRNFYIGLSTNVTTGNFTWIASDGNLPADSSFNMWPFSQPPTVSAGERKCAFTTHGPYYNWGYGDCSDSLGFICQAHYTKPLVMDVIHVPLKCDPPFQIYHDGCYFFSPEDQFLNWDAANNYCREQNSSLVEIHTGGEDQFIRDKLSGDAWLGLRRISASTANAFFQNSQGVNLSSTAYTNFAPPQKDKFCYAMDIFSANPGRWTPMACTDKMLFVCYHRGDPITTTNPDDDPHRLTSEECGEGWIYFSYSKSCYKISFNPIPQSLAAQSCQNEDTNSNLLYITSPEEEFFLRDILSGMQPNVLYAPELFSTPSYWTSMTIVARDQWHWKYRSDSLSNMWRLPMAYTHWGPGEPDPTLTYSVSSPKCMYFASDWTSRWGASSCTQLRASICKRPATYNESLISTTPQPSALPVDFALACPQKWILIGDYCYQRDDTVLVVANWTAAQAACRTQNANLVRLISAEQTKSIEHLTANGWIGLNSIGRSVDPRIYENVDGSPVLYTPWTTQISRNFPSNANCVATVNSLGVAAYDCNEIRPFTCMLNPYPVEVNPPDCVKPPHDNGCRMWGNAWRDSCFYFGNQPNTPLGTRKFVNFEEARTFCRVHYNADLAVINTMDQQEFLTSVLGVWSGDYWVGLKGQGDPWNAFKTWVTGESVKFTNWGHSEPNPSQVAGGCAALLGSKTEVNLPGDWYVNSCSERKFALCEGPREGYTPPTVGTTAFLTGCPRGWDFIGNSPCYKIFYAPPSSPGDNVDPVKLTWQQAEDSCIEFRGHLASIGSSDEQAVVMIHFPKVEAGYTYWIGLHEQGDGSWAWSDGQPYGTTTFWHPTDHGSNQLLDCVGMDAESGKWVQQNCNLGAGWVCELPKGLYYDGEEIPTIHSPTTTNETCAGTFAGTADWYYDTVTDTCYMISKTPNTWDNAEKSCNGINGHLPTVASDQHNFLAIILSRHMEIGQSFWIGLRLVDPVNKRHQWIDGSTSLYREWDRDEPNPTGVQACVGMNNRNGKWVDEYCLKELPFVCAVSKAPVVTPYPPPDNSDLWGCPSACIDTFRCVAFRGYCYVISVSTDIVDWKTANDRCSNIYIDQDDHSSSSYLVSIHDQLEQDFLLGQLGKIKDGLSRWTGLHEDPKNRGAFYWSDNTLFDFTFWNWPEPFIADELKCVMMYSDIAKAGRWNDDNCLNKAPYICKMKKTNKFFTMPTLSPQTQCKAGYESISTACFNIKALPSGGGTWQQARDYCFEVDGSRIATVLDVFENAFLHTELAKKVNFTPSAAGSRAWIGMKSQWLENSGSLNWHSGCLTSFNYLTNFLDGSSHNESCVAMDYGGKWRTQTCDAEKNEFVICETRTPECIKKPVYNDGLCPLGFIHECADYCYQVMPGAGTAIASGHNVSWHEAKDECARQNATLVSIKSKADFNCLEKVIEQSSDPMWIGLEAVYDTATRKITWKWMNPEVTTGSYSNWAKGEPNGFTWLNKPRDACAEMYSSGEWNDVNCDGPRLGYICEKKKISYDESTTPVVTTSISSVATSPLTTQAIQTSSLQTITTKPTTESTTTSPVTISTPDVTTKPSEATTKESTLIAVSTTTETTPRATETATPTTRGTTTAEIVTVPSIITNVPETTTQGSTSINTSPRPTINETGREVPGTEKLNLGGSAGTYAGVAVAVIIIVPGLTYAAYYFWHRRASSRSPLAPGWLMQTTSYNSSTTVDEDRQPVIDVDFDQSRDSYT